MLKKVIFLSSLLFVCIMLMVSALLMDAETFGEVSSYFSIVCVLLSLIGVVIMIRKNKF